MNPVVQLNNLYKMCEAQPDCEECSIGKLIRSHSSKAMCSEAVRLFADEAEQCISAWMKEHNIHEQPCIKPAMKVQTSAGTLTAKYYDDGIAEGIQISLGGDIIAMVDVYKEENAECRVLTYKVDQDEPYRCVSVNR